MFFILLQNFLSFSRKSEFRISDIQIAQQEIYIILNNLGNKNSLVMLFGQFMSRYKRKKFIYKKTSKTATWKLVRGSFVIAKNSAQPLLENEIVEPTCLY